MPEINSKRFVELFQSALSKGGRLADDDLSALKSARSKIDNARERAAADSILAMVSHDQELDSFEVTPARKALGILSGVSSDKLPADLERVLTHAVPQANVTVKNYDLSFDFSKDGASFPGRALITLDAKAPKQIVLEANPERLAIEKVLADGKAVKFEARDGRLFVDAPGAKALDIQYRVTPADARGPEDKAYGLIRDRYSGRMWTLTWPYNTGALFPSNSLPADGATAKVTVKVGAGQEAVVGDSSKGQAPAYGIAFYTADKFESSSAGTGKSGVSVTGYGFDKRVSQTIRETYRKTAREALDFYSSWLGGYDYGKALKLIEVEGELGGMEHTGAVAIMMGAARDPSYSQQTAAHETAHHWFGDNVRIKDWGDFWMSEGFTDYATFRFFRQRDGEEKYRSLWSNAKDEIRSALQDNPHALAAPADTDVNEIFDSIPYKMGAWMLRMLESQLGTPQFDALLKDWFKAKRQKAVTTADFVAFAKKETGKDLAPFFKAWNELKELPRLDGKVEASGNKATATLTPKSDLPGGIRIPLRLEGDGGKSKTVLVEPGKPMTIDAGFPIKKWKWDPEETVLADVS